jgi:hypothetical protein
MMPRLLTLLSLIESALGAQAKPGAVARSVNYREGIAWMTFAEGDRVVVQNFQLGDGQLCMRVNVSRAGADGGAELFIYPQAVAFDWTEAAARVAREWMGLAPAQVAATISA